MNVLIVTALFPPDHLGGYEIACQSFVRHLEARGYSVRILAGQRPAAGEPAVRTPVYRELEWYKDDDLVFRSPRRLARPVLERRNLAALRRHVSEFSPHIVNWWAMGGMPLSLIESVRRMGLPAIGMVSDEWMIYGQEVDAWLRTCARAPSPMSALAHAVGVPARVDFARAATWSFVSEFLRDTVLDAGIRLTHTCIGRTGINADELAPRSHRADFAGSLLYAGRVTPAKGVDVAVRALAQLPAHHRLRVVGPVDGSYGAQLTQLASDRGVSDRLSLEPPLPRAALGDAYREADAVLFPVTWNEPWGLVPLEAMACGAPVIATGTGGSAEYLEHERNCLIVDTGSANSLARAIERTAESPALRESLHRGGLETASRYSEAACNATFEHQLVEAASRGTSAR
jgi:glycosyltransferase involved in cell wall biosynthesis